jgi:hypothetical protein
MALKDEQWPVARLIPISTASGIEAQERRAASALLAVVAAVSEFGRALLRPLGAPAGRIEAFIEVPFRREGRQLRPDGIVLVTRGQRIWGAIIEAKVGSNSVEAEQIDQYLDLARDLGFDAVLSISNQYVTSSSPYPVQVDKRKLKRVRLFHWSWVSVLTEATLQKEHRGVSDPDQAYILEELIRYLSDPRSGAVSFESMGPSWTAVRDGARQGTLRRSDPEVAAVAARWDELIRYLCLELTTDLGQDVRQTLARTEHKPSARLARLGQSLVESGQLHADLRVPNAAGPLHLLADLRSRQVTVSTSIEAPTQGTSKGRVSWLLKQLPEASGHISLEAKIARSQSSLAGSLTETRETPARLYPEGGREIRQFMVSATRNMGLKRDAGRGSFIESVITASKDFYGEVLQNLRAWKPPPPKLKQPAPEDAAEQAPPTVAEAIAEAEQEHEEDATSPAPHSSASSGPSEK